MRPSILASAAFLICSSARAQGWPQWGQNPQHSGSAPVIGQSAVRPRADLVYDPFIAAEQAESGGALLVHYQVPLIDGADVFMQFKTGRYISCVPPGQGAPAPCGVDARDRQIWGERRLTWENGALIEKWRFESDWKPEPDAGGLGGWEPVFHPVLAGDFLYVPGAGGSVFKVARADGSVIARIQPFGDTIDPSIFVAGPLTADRSGAIYFNALKLALSTDPAKNHPWSADVAGAWLVKIGPGDSAVTATFASLTPGAPAAGDLCATQFAAQDLPWPPSPGAAPPLRACGSQRPGLNVAPAVAPDGTVYTVSRAHLNGQYAYLAAANPDLSPKWAASLRDRLADGCDRLLPPSGQPGGCRAGATPGVDPATNQMPAGRVTDDSSSSPVVAPDGAILYGAFTRYNYARGHLMKFTAAGGFAASYTFGWDLTPAVYAHDGGYSVVVKDNHYDAGSYCNDDTACPPAPPGPYFITQLSSDLQPEWVYENFNTQSCTRAGDGALHCAADHPNGFEWCVNAPAVDSNGLVYANSEDGSVYVIAQGGALNSALFLQLALGAAYTPIALGPDGMIYAQNDGHLFALGN